MFWNLYCFFFLKLLVDWIFFVLLKFDRIIWMSMFIINWYNKVLFVNKKFVMDIVGFRMLVWEDFDIILWWLVGYMGGDMIIMKEVIRFF